jgi:hypothetical protein
MGFGPERVYIIALPVRPEESILPEDRVYEEK